MHKKIALLALILTLLVSVAFAHPGRLDSNGGHHDRADGSYHYHSGENAGKSSGSMYYYDNDRPKHTHPNGICPYGKQGVVPLAKSPSIIEAAVKTVLLFIFGITPFGMLFALLLCRVLDSVFKAETFRGVRWPFSPIAALLAFAPYCFFLIMEYSISWHWWALLGVIYFCILLDCHLHGRTLAKQELEEQIKVETQRLREMAKYTQLFAEHTIEDLSNFPHGTIIGKDGLPKEENAVDWGDLYTVYVSPHGRAYHYKKCSSAANIPTHALDARRYYAPCKKCKPQLPNMDWFTEYQKLNAIKKKYNIQ